jgi:AsmA protein
MNLQRLKAVMKSRKLLLSFIVIGVSFVIVSLVLPFIIDLNSYKPRIESAASDALGLHVAINGSIEFNLLPDVHISLGNIKITGRESDIAAIEKVQFGLNILPLFIGRVSIDEIAINNPEISLIRFRNGEFNVTQKTQKKTKQEEKGTSPFVANSISLSGGDIVFSDQKNGTITKFQGVVITIKNLLVRNTMKRSLIHGLSFQGNVDLKKITSHAVELSDLTFQISAKEGLYNIRELSTTLFSGKGKGEATFDVTDKTPSLIIQTTISKIRLEEFFHALSEKKSMEGEVDLTLNLSMQGKGIDDKKKTINGHISMQGENIVIRNYDIDSILRNYRKTQRIGALDIGAFFLLGPVGTAVTKGYDYEELYRSTGARGGIMKKLVSVWKVEKGIATAEDVAISTRENRLAVKGKLNFVNGMYEDIIVAVIDKRGCAELTQKIYGSLNNPQLKKTTVLQSTAGSVLSLIGKAGKIIPGAKCEAFYGGSIQHSQ